MQIEIKTLDDDLNTLTYLHNSWIWDTLENESKQHAAVGPPRCGYLKYGEGKSKSFKM